MNDDMNRKEFIKTSTLGCSSILILNGCDLFSPGKKEETITKLAPVIELPQKGEDIFSYINRKNKVFDQTLFRQILGAANEYKEGDETLRVAAVDDNSRKHARMLLANTTIGNFNKHTVYNDEIEDLIRQTTLQNGEMAQWTFQELKQFCLNNEESTIKSITPGLSSDVIACLVKLLSNEELIQLSQKIFNPLPNSKIGSKGYMGARVQPNSPTDNIEDITWQVFNAWAFAVGDVVLGTNPVSSDPESVAKIESALLDIIKTFELEETIPNCVLAHVDIQAEVEETNPGTTGIWFQSIAGTVNANKTFDVTLEKMMKYASVRDGQYGFYAETGQGADMTNGHGEGFDMVMHESRKYGFLRALKQKINQLKGSDNSWVHVNDVAGFIGPEVFKTREQLVRCCLEDTVMGKLHGLTIGLDICSTLHMEVNLEDLDWCIEHVMPANPAYLMALPTKNDPMLSYLTTAFSNHVKVREQFGYKVNDAMWKFFKKLDIIDAQGKPTKHFGDPVWVYYQYLKRKSDKRPKADIYTEGLQIIKQIEDRGVAIARGYGKNIWDLEPGLDEKVHRLYADAKVSLWTEMKTDFIKSIPAIIPVTTSSENRKDYVYHPESGEVLNEASVEKITAMKQGWKNTIPKVQIVISDGLNAKALMDEGHLKPYLQNLVQELKEQGYSVSNQFIFIENGRVRAGYACGELLFGRASKTSKHAIVHIIGERPGSGHHNFSAYLTVANAALWNKKGVVDHDISRVISGISDTALVPEKATAQTLKNLEEMFLNEIETPIVS